MKTPFSLILALFVVLPSLLKGDTVEIIPVLAWRGDEIVWLERDAAMAHDEVASGLGDMVQAQLDGVSSTEEALGLTPFFPHGSSYTVETEGRTSIVHLTLPEPIQGDEGLVRESLGELLGYFEGMLVEVDELKLLAAVAGEDAAILFEGFLPPPASKPKSKEMMAGDDEVVEMMSVPHAPAQGTAQPVGALSDASIFLSPGHGWFWSSTLGRWATQRGNLHQYIEDHGTAEAVLQYLHQYLWNAGARVYTARERDLNTNMAIVEHGGAGYEQTGSWTVESASGAYEGSHRRALTVTGEPTATARFTPDIPEGGNYAVYVWYRPSTGGTTAADSRITINHTGDSTLWVQNQNRDGFTWKYIGTYYFDEGSNPETGSVLIDNQSSVAGHHVIANAVRFGGGMGDMPDNVGGVVSGKPRWEESGRYYAGFMGKSNWASSNQVSAMPRWAAWEHESWEDGKSVYVSWHTNAGGGTGTETFSHNTPVPGSHQLRNRIHDQVVRDIRAAWNPSWADRGRKTANFGELNPNNNPHMPAALLEVGFHDHANDTKYLLDPEFRRQVARAVYQGLVQFYAYDVSGFNNATYLPEPPQGLRAKANSDGTITLDWDAPQFSTGMTGLYGHAATGYRVYQSRNGRGFDNGFSVTGTTATLSDVEPGEVVYVRVSATNAGGESFPTSTLAARSAHEAPGQILIVNGFNRNDRFMNVVEADPHSANSLQRGYTDRLNTYNYILPHAQAIEAYPETISFDSAEAAAVDNGDISLLDYDAVIWMAGLQADVNDIGSRSTPAFSGTLYNRLAQYRDAGGQLFLSGAEVAWDVDRAGMNSWMKQVLRAELISRSASSNSAAGRSATIMADWSAQFDDGSGPVYRVEYPDVIEPTGGATSVIEYTGTSDQLVDGFESMTGWQQPGWSGSTTADPAGSFSIVSSPVYQGNGSGYLAYIWGGSGTFIRVHNQAQPQFPADSDLSVWVYGDNSGHLVRFSVRDSDGELYANQYTPIDFTGWREIVWEDIRNNSTRWAGTGDGVVTGPVGLESIQLSKTSSGPSSGDLYFDNAVATPVDTGNDGVSTAAIQYDGDHKVVYLAFPFESITSDVEQADLMTRTLDFFGFSLTPIENWRQTHFTEDELDDASISGDTADASGDGIPNILKYALNLNPRESSREGLPAVSVEEGFLTFGYNVAKAATDLIFEVEISDDLVSWRAAGDEVEIVDETDEGDTVAVTVRDKTPFPESERRFIRLRVNRAL